MIYLVFISTWEATLDLTLFWTNTKQEVCGKGDLFASENQNFTKLGTYTKVHMGI